MAKDLIKVRNQYGEVFNVYYEPRAMCWIQEGTSFYYNIEDWQHGVITKVED